MIDDTIPESQRTPAEPLAGPLARGAIIGRYVLLGEIGAGGMGVVYEAYDPDLDRKVALKLLRPGVAGGLVAEAQAMARLAHPNVIAVYDVGTAGDQVFVTMEHVAGATLADLTSHARPWREVLALLVQAGRGLAAAHAAGLIHRDFKPRNVLVSDDGDEERARVVDFGLARAADEAGGEPAGTPAYMAPEQLARGGAVGPASDQWSFAVTLHEALWGARPFGGDTLEELAGNIRAGRRRPPPRAREPRWVAAVVDRALAPAPEARWPSMDALLAALDRDPAARRRKIATAAFFAVALVLGATGVTGFLQRGPRPCLGAAAALGEVWGPARRARVAAAFRASGSPRADASLARVGALLDERAAGWVAAHTGACQAARVRGEESEEQLGLRLRCLDERRRELDALAALLEHADAATVVKAVDAALALPPLARCADVKALASRIPPPADPETARRVAEVRALLAQVRSLKAMGKYREGLALALAAGAAGRALDYCPLRAETDLLVGDLQEPLGQLKESTASLFDALVAAEACRYDEAAARVWSMLAYNTGVKMARVEEGERWSRHAAAVIERLGGNDQLESARLSQLGMMLDSKGRYDEALAAHARALELGERSLGKASATLIGMHVNYAITLKNVDRAEESMAELEKAMAIVTGAMGGDHPLAARIHLVMGSTLQKLGKLDGSLEHQRRALAILEAVTPTGTEIGAARNNMANTLVMKGDYAAAEGLYRQALVALAAALGKDHPNVARATAGLGLCLYHQGRLAEARAALRESIAATERGRGVDSIELVSSLPNLALVDVADGRFADAEREARRAAAIIEKAAGAESATLTDTLNVLGIALEKQRRWPQALAVFTRAAALAEKAGLPGAAEPLAGVGRCQLELGRRAEAVAALERALALEEQRGSPDDLAEIRRELARARAAR